MTRDPPSTRTRSVLRWLLLVRALVVLALSAALLLAGSDHPLLGNLLATFWLIGAVLTLRWARDNRGRRGARAAVLAGVVGVMAAITGLTRVLIEGTTSTDTALAILGTLTVAIGLLRVVGAFRDRTEGRHRTIERFALGVSEIGLGMVWIAVDELSSGVRVAAGLWALVGGTVMLLDALDSRRADDR